MARRLIITGPALADLEHIAEHIAIDSPKYASAVVRAILDALQDVKRFPRIGRVVPETSDADLRELIVYSYRVIYRLHDDAEVIRLVAVIHGARDLGHAVRDRPT